MSDFSNDEFTAELKSYFLQNLLMEITDHIDLIDESTWKRIRTETSRQAMEVWSVDARTNDFIYFASWLEQFEQKTKIFESASALKKYLTAIKEYVKTLMVEKVDSAELTAKFSAWAESNSDSLVLHCRFGNHNFAIPVGNVVEIIKADVLFSLPEKRTGLLGVIPFRGDAIPVIHFQDFGFVSDNLNQFCYVVCELDEVRFSLQVNETHEVIKLRESELQKAEGHSAVIQTPFVKQFYIQGLKNIMILDLNKLVA